METRNVELDSKFCREHSFDRPGSYVLLSVTDTGVGIDSTTIDHIFEPFFTTKSQNKGTGLGLATVYGIVKQHGGFIFATARREPARVSAFICPQAPAATSTSEAVRLNEPPKGTETILLAEDHEGLRSTAQEMLQNLGYRVMTAADGQESVDVFNQHHSQIDLIIMDVIMPILSGPEAYSRMCAVRQDLRVILPLATLPKQKTWSP